MAAIASEAAKTPTATTWWTSADMKKSWGEWVEKFDSTHAKLAAAAQSLRGARGELAKETMPAKWKERQLQVVAARKAELNAQIEWHKLHVAFREAQHKKAVESYENELKIRTERIKKLQDQLAAIK
jgi:hypothetical protein